MALEMDLALGVLSSHPLDAARVLERLPAEETGAFLSEADPALGAAALRAMHAPAAANVLGLLTDPCAAALVEKLSLDLAASLLRLVPEERRTAILSAAPERLGRALGSLLRFVPNTAGALMDPAVLAVPQDVTVEQALALVREAAGQARYNVYTVDREQLLVGVVNLRELFLAEPTQAVSTIAQPRPHRLMAGADRRAIIAHPGWKQVHSLPVVDEQGLYLGALRYRTLRRIEAELLGTAADESATARALGDLFRTGANSLLEALAASAPAADAGGPRAS